MLAQLKDVWRRWITRPLAETPAAAEPPIAEPTATVETIPVIGETIPAASETPAPVAPAPAVATVQPPKIVLYYAMGVRVRPCTKHHNCTCRSYATRAFEQLADADRYGAWLLGQGYAVDLYRCEFDAGALPASINPHDHLELAATATPVMGFRPWHKKSIGVG